MPTKSHSNPLLILRIQPIVRHFLQSQLDARDIHHFDLNGEELVVGTGLVSATVQSEGILIRLRGHEVLLPLHIDDYTEYLNSGMFFEQWLTHFVLRQIYPE